MLYSEHSETGNWDAATLVVAPLSDLPAVASAKGAANSAYDLHPDGKRVATAVAPEQASVVWDKVVFVSNFGDYLRTITK